MPRHGTQSTYQIGCRCAPCTDANRVACRKYYRANRERILKDRRANANYRADDLKRNYGMTVEDWEQLFASQGCKCACCGGTETTHWATDHDQSTQHVRGILCNRCNLMLGWCGDQTDSVRTNTNALLKYLERPQTKFLATNRHR